MMDNFADHPPTLGEIRSNKSESCTDWSPRDVLIQVLRQIDSGALTADVMVVCWREKAPSACECDRGRFRVASPDTLTALGLLSHTAFKMME